MLGLIQIERALESERCNKRSCEQLKEVLRALDITYGQGRGPRAHRQGQRTDEVRGGPVWMGGGGVCESGELVCVYVLCVRCTPMKYRRLLCMKVGHSTCHS